MGLENLQPIEAIPSVYQGVETAFQPPTVGSGHLKDPDFDYNQAQIATIRRELGLKTAEEKTPYLNSLLEELKLNKLPSTAELNSMYHYAPNAPSTASTEKLNLALSPEHISQIRSCVCPMLTADEKNIKKFIPIDATTTINLIKFESRYPRKDCFEIHLIKNDEQIADFYCSIDEAHNWKLEHRWIDNKYRNQGIGKVMIKLMEECCQEFCNIVTSTQQQLVFDVQQLGVINFALQNGYAPINDANHQFLKSLLGGSDQFIVATATGYQYSGGDRPGFIFSREKILQYIQEYNDDDDYPRAPLPIPTASDYDIKKTLDSLFCRDPHVYEGESFKIQLAKTIAPDKTALH